MGNKTVDTHNDLNLGMHYIDNSADFALLVILVFAETNNLDKNILLWAYSAITFNDAM